MADKTMDRQSFIDERARLAAQLATQQSRLESEQLSAKELSSLPGQIAETRAALGVLDHRIGRFELEDLDAQIAALESDTNAHQARMTEVTSGVQRFGEWQRAHDQILNSMDGNVKAVTALYAEILPAVVEFNRARTAFQIALADARDAKTQRKELLKKVSSPIEV
jgi:chromosome segregation ATPase